MTFPIPGMVPIMGFGAVSTGVQPNPLELRKLTHFEPKNDLVGSPPRRYSEVANATATLKPSTPPAPIPAMWDLVGKYTRFVPVALAFAGMSKLPGTKVGCVILGDAFQVLSSGWNGAPRGCDADQDERLIDRETRLDWTVHAEANAIANAARSGTALEGGTLICTLMPCITCAKLIAQAGIERVLCPKPGTEDNERWGREFDLTRRLFEECDIDLIHYDTSSTKDSQ